MLSVSLTASMDYHRMDQQHPYYTHISHISGLFNYFRNIQCPQWNMQTVKWLYRCRGRKWHLEIVPLLIINTLCLSLILKITEMGNCNKYTSLMMFSAAKSADMMIPDTCEQNMSVTSIEGFNELTSNIQNFLYYRHCRHFPMLLDVPKKCHIPKGSGQLVLLLAIKTSPKNYNRRAVLRKTWAAERQQDGVLIRTVFLSGTDETGFETQRLNKLLELENIKHHDILQWDFTESFQNLTLKQVLFLDWLQNWCPTADFIFNGDDDVFANTDNMVAFLKGLGDNDGSKHLYIGQLVTESAPIREKHSKYYVPEQIKNSEMYDPYCSGGGYIFSRFTGRSIFQTSQSITLMPIDDAYMGMCLKQAGLQPMSHQGFWATGLTVPSKQLDIYDPCHYREIILSHKFPPHQIFVLWNEIHRKDLNCSKKVVDL